MKKFKKVFACICVCACLMASFALPAYAADPVPAPASSDASQTQAGTARIDVIVTKYRLYYGVVQYRRWNETWGYWVDPDWIDLPTA